MRTFLTPTLFCLAFAVSAIGQDKSAKPNGTGQSSTASIPAVRESNRPPVLQADQASEAEVLNFVREHHPELATVLGTLKPMNPVEYRKAIAELTEVAHALANLKARNPRRYELALDGWKAKSRVELLAAQLAGSPNEELRSQLRTAIEAKIEVDIRRHRYDLEQSEASGKRAREALDRLENHRDAVVEARFRGLQPKKLAKSKKPADSPKTPSKPSDKPASPPAQNPDGEERR